MKKTMLIALLSFALAGAAWADSRTNRGNKSIFVGLSPVGGHVATIITPPIGVGVYLSESLMVGGEFGSRSYTFEDSENDGEADATFNNVGAYLRWFPGTNSFNVGVALHNRTMSGDATVDVTDEGSGGTAVVEADFTSATTVGSLILGNQWMLDFGLVISLDWVVLSTPLSASTTSDVVGRADGQTITNSETDEAEADLRDLGDRVNQAVALPGVAVLTIGWAF